MVPWSLPVDQYRIEPPEVPATQAKEYALARFYLPVEEGLKLMPLEAPAWWIREVSDPAEPGAVWYIFGEPGAMVDLECGLYVASSSGRNATWELSGYGDAFGGRSYMSPGFMKAIRQG